MNLIQAAESILSLQVEHPTPIRDLLGKLISDREYTNGSRTKFLANPLNRMSVEAKTNFDRESQAEVLSHIEVNMYGVFTFDGDEDKYAKVVLKYWFHTNTLTAWTKADRWKGGNLVDMPEGARKKIAAAVVETVGPFHEWAALAWEDQRHRAVLELNSKLTNAAGQLTAAVKDATNLGVTL
jgi:hypothetical protein